MIQRIEPFFFEYDSKNRTFFFSNWNFWKIVKKIKIDFFHMTRRIEPAFFQYDSKNWTFSIGLKDLMLFSLTQRIELFLTRTDRIGPFSWIWLRELKFFLGFFTCLLFWKMMQRIEPFFLWIWRIEPFVLWMWLKWRKELNPFFLFEAKKRTFISLTWMTPRIVFFKQKILNELNFLKYDSKNWTFEPCVKKNREWNSEKYVELWLKWSKWLIELNLFFWTFSRWLKELKSFCSMTPRVQLFLCSNMSQRIDPFFFWLKELCVFLIWLKELNPFSLNMTQRIEPFVFFQNVSKNWIFFSKKCSKNWTSLSFELLLFTWLNELNFFQFDSKSWVFSNKYSKTWTFV